MLPQAALTPWVVSRPRRTRIWMAGAAGQGLAALAMAGLALTLEGWGAGLGILLALAVFSLSRALCSIAGKDVQGRAVPKGQRGQVTGVSTAVAGVVAVGIGVVLQLLGPDLSPAALAVLLAAAALTWLVAVPVFAGIPEDPPGSGEEEAPGAGDQPPGVDGEPGARDGQPSWRAGTVGLLREDRDLRRFVIARALLLVSALTPPFLVSLAVAEGTSLLTGLGSFVIAQGVASVLGGRIFGRWSDASSRGVMALGGLLASVVVLAVVVAVLVGPRGLGLASLVAGYFVVSLVHVGVRVARKTYVVDLAEGDLRTRYVAVANTAMGLVLLVTGAASAALATWGEPVALTFLATLGLVGAVASWRLPEVSRVG